MELTLLQYAFAGLSVLVGATFGSIFGGSSFLIQPALLALNVPPQMAVANDVASAAFASLAFLIAFRKTRRPRVDIVKWMIPTLIGGAFIGGHLLSFISASIIMWMILCICGLGMFYTLLHVRRKTADTEHFNPIPYWQPALVVGALFLGLYDGISGAGSGILLIAILSVILRADMKSLVGIAVFSSAISLMAAGATYVWLGLLDWKLMALMVPANIMAGWLGAKIVHILPESVLRLMYGVVVSALLVYLLFKVF